MPKHLSSLLGSLGTTLLLQCLVACTQSSTQETTAQPPTALLDIQGHRGARGLMPENTWPAFETALRLGATTLELDVVISQDDSVVVSHEPWFNPTICLGPNADTLVEEPRVNLYTLPYTAIATYNCGSLPHPRFPEQELQTVAKPTLGHILQRADSLALALGRPLPRYNIELKSSPEGDGTFHPAPKEFSALVHATISRHTAWERVTIQCFDFRVLQHWHSQYPGVSLAALVAEESNHEKVLEALGFTPDIYSCHFPLLNPENIKAMQAQGMQVIPWTVNEPKDLLQLIDWGVNGIITDYPNRLVELSKPPTLSKKN